MNLTTTTAAAAGSDIINDVEDEFFFCRNFGNSTTPLANECFVDGLRHIPNGFLILTSLPILIAWRKSQSDSDHMVTWVHFPRHTIRWIFSLCLIVLVLLQFSEALVSDSLHQGTRLRIIMPHFIGLFASILSIVYYHNAELSNSPRFLLLLIPYWGSSLAVEAMKVVNMNYKGLSFIYMRPILSRAGIGMYSIMLLIELDVLRVLRYAFFKQSRTLYPPEDLDRITYLQSYVCFISKATFQWIFKILTVGYKRPLELADLGFMPKEESSAENYAKLTRAIAKEKDKSQKRLPSLWRVYWRAYWPWMLVAAGLRLLGDLLTFVGPLLLGGIIIFVENCVQDTKSSNSTTLPMKEQFVTVYSFFSNGYIMALMLFISTLLMNMCLQAQHFLSVREGVRLRSAIQMLIYKKTLSLSLRVSDPRKMLSDRLVDHITVDANNLFFYMYTFNLVWALPLKVTMAFGILYYFLGRSTLVAAAVIVILSSVQFILSNAISKFKHKYKRHCDARLVECNNLFSAIKLVKVYAWEAWFRRDIAIARRKERQVLAKMAAIKAASMFITETTPVIVTLVAFALYPYLESEPLTPSVAFTSLALLDILGLPLTLFPILIDFITKARRSTDKLQKFLAEPEIKQNRPLCPWYSEYRRDDSETKDSRVKFEMNSGPKVSIIETAASPQTASPVVEENPTPFPELPDVTKLSDHSPINLGLIGEGEEHELEVISEEEDEQAKSERECLLPSGLQEEEDRNHRDSSVDTDDGEEKERKKKHGGSGHQSSTSYLHERYSRQYSSTVSSTPGSINDDESVDLNRDQGVALEIKDGCFCWNEHEDEEPHLNDINFKADAGSLTMIVGKLHSGKSSLLAALLGEMTKLKGTVAWKSGVTVGYVAENPWLLNTTLQENILFGRHMEKRRYKRVISACGLQPDIDILPEGEQTLIGEQGLGLGRGQRQRVSLARAMYSRADVVLMDQPFSSLDLATSAHVFEQGILRWMLKRKRTVILVSHQLQYLAFADMVYRLENGQITHSGHLQEIKVADPALFARWRTIVKEERKELTHSEEEAKTKADRSKLRRKISTMEFQRELAQSVVAVGSDRSNSAEPKEVLMNQQFAQMSFFSDTQADVETKPVSSQPTMAKHIELEEEIPDLIMEQDAPDPKPKRKTLAKLISTKDERVHGVVNFDLLMSYVRACSVALTIGVLVLHVSRMTLAVSADFWLAHWTTTVYSQTAGHNSSMALEESGYYIDRYIGIVVAAVVLSALLVFCAEYTGFMAAQKLHSDMADHIIFAPMKFFDTTPISQILNRFSADVNTIDDKLPATMEHFLRTQLMCIAAMVVNCIATPWYLIVIIVVVISYYSVLKFFKASAREFLKLDNISKPPILAHFTETVLGLPVIRAYRDEGRFLDIMHKHIDLNTLAFLWMHTANRWMGLRMEHLASIMVFGSAVASIAVGCTGAISPGVVGVAIAYTLMMLSYSNFVVRSGADTELQLHAVERVCGYTRVDTEEDVQGDILGEGAALPVNWPTAGDVRFVGVSLKYDTAPTPILRDISFHLAPKQKLGVCGTDHGSGKSSLALGLWRLLDTCNGHIHIDGFDIRHVSLSVLRSNITLVPQDPTLLSGSIRYNLDPSGQYSDVALWQSLDRAGVKDKITALPQQMESSTADFSIGQRQLLCIARALLRQTRILVFDQIVSFVDIETEEIIHKVIDTQLQDVTVIHIAHNASWLMNYDSILVLRRGFVVEYGTPQRLMGKKDSIFRHLVKKSPKQKPKDTSN